MQEFVPEIFNTSYYYYLDSLYSIIRSINHRNNITISDLEKMKGIATTAYPENMQFILQIHDLKDLIEYCHCIRISQIDLIIKDSWYLLVANHYNCIELIDCAGKDGRCFSVLQIYNFLKTKYRGKLLVAECREKTSYPLFALLNKKGRICFQRDDIFHKNGEIMHYIKFSIPEE